MKKILLFLFLLTAVNLAQDIKFKGYGAAGYRFIDRIRIIEYNQETYFEGKFQAEFEVNKHIEAQLDFRGNSEDQQVELREFSAKFSFLEHLKFEIGNIKKPFGAEYIESREDLAAVNRSFLTEAAGEIGYIGRSVGVMAYYKTKDKKAYPHSYYFYIFKNNNLQNGITGRYVHHFDDINIGGSYFLLNTGGDYPITTSGLAASFLYKKKDFLVESELMFLQDPVEAIRRGLQEMDKDVIAWGARVQSVIEFDTGDKIIEEIEPFVLLSYFQPDTKIADQHTIQTLVGVNFYFDKDVRLRLNADALFTRNEFNYKYNTHDSRIILEVQVRY
ncbi:MAG: hypothetical protein R6W90_06760 [Ignavibacteriaceae bacterium]